MNAFALMVQALCVADFSGSQFSLAAEAPGGVLGFTALLDAAVIQFVRHRRPCTK